MPPTAYTLTLSEASARLAEVRAAMGRAAARAGRDVGDITLLGVSKTFPAAMVRAYWEAGLRDFGENYIQEARDKAADLAREGLTPTWHFIGHLQTNKAKYAAALFPVIHSLDNLELAEELNRRATRDGRTIKIYVQINVSGEASKSGLTPEALPDFLKVLSGLPALIPQGLMTMPPYDPDPERSRPHFAALRRLRDQYAPHLPGLSMGMSGDFEVAIEEGATIIRVGTALFGPRG